MLGADQVADTIDFCEAARVASGWDQGPHQQDENKTPPNLQVDPTQINFVESIRNLLDQQLRATLSLTGAAEQSMKTFASALASGDFNSRAVPPEQHEVVPQQLQGQAHARSCRWKYDQLPVGHLPAPTQSQSARL